MFLEPSHFATSLKRLWKFLLLTTLLGLVVACGKGFQSPLDDQASSSSPQTRAQQKATPTVDEIFSADPYVINTGKAKIRVGLLKTENMNVVFDNKTREFTIQGEASLTDANTKNKVTFPFNLSGNVSSDGFADLQPQEKEKKSSREIPHFRAKITCLTPKENGNYDCASALIDLIVRYQSVLHTDQLETRVMDSESPLANTEPAKNAPIEKKKKSSTATNNKDSSIDEVNASDGRYVGRIWEDLNSLFDEPLDPIEDDALLTPPKTSGAQPTSAPAAKAPAPTSPPKSPSSPAPGAKSPGPTDPTIKTMPPSASAQEAEIGGTKPCRDGVTYMKNGNPRPCNQSIYDSVRKAGRLENGSSLMDRFKLLKDQAKFQMTNTSRERYYGSYDLIELIHRLGNKFFSLTSGKPMLQTGDLSQLGGGVMNGSEHASHQMGTDVDFRFPVKTPRPRKVPEDLSVVDDNGKLRDDFMVDKMWMLFKYMVNDSNIKIRWIFVAQPIKDALCMYADRSGDFRGAQKQNAIEVLRRIYPEADHTDHFHVRIECTPDHPRCRDPRNGPFVTHNCRNL